MTDPILRVGEVLAARYMVESPIGEGGMQQVFRAVDRAFERPVVVKVPKNPSAERRFERSAQVSAQVNHPHVAKTLDYFDENGRSHLVEELVLGTDLGHVLDEHFTYLDPHLTAHLLHHLVTGLAAAHHAKVFHRDLKPSNIMVSSDPGLTVVKITDFGIAKMAEEELNEAIEGGNDSITSSHTALGALPYIAPEMIDAPRSAGQPADIWAVGAILYHLVSGHAPYGKGLRIVPAILEAKLPAKPEPFVNFTQFSSLSDDIWAIIQACLKKNPGSRPTADQLVTMCSTLCYADSSRQEGEILNYGAFRGAFGFIRANDGTQVFFPGEALYGAQPIPGLKVNFAAHPGSPRDRAYPVLALRQ